MSPLYNSQVATNSPLHAIYPGDTFPLFSAESPLTGQASIQVPIGELWQRRVTGISVEIIFSANPGAFNFQIQGADTDNPAAYFTEGSGTVNQSTAMADGTFRARVELSPWVAKFMRLLINTQTANAVTVSANVTAI